MVCGQEYEVTLALTDKFQNQVSSVTKFNNDVGKVETCLNLPSNKKLLKSPVGVKSQDIKMAFQTKKVDVKNLMPAPDRPRIFMSNKTSKVVVVFPNGEVVEGK